MRGGGVSGEGTSGGGISGRETSGVRIGVSEKGTS